MPPLSGFNTTTTVVVVTNTLSYSMIKKTILKIYSILIIRNLYLNSYGILEIFALTLVVNVDVYLKLLPVCLTKMNHCLI